MSEGRSAARHATDPPGTPPATSPEPAEPTGRPVPQAAAPAADPPAPHAAHPADSGASAAAHIAALVGPPESGGGPVRARLAVVRCGGRQASGYLLAPRLVLTAAHAVEGEDAVRVTVPGPRGEVVCERAGVWQREQAGIDVTLLTSADDLAGDEHFDRSGRTWAQVSALGPVPGCVAIGFPFVQRDAAGRLDSEQLTGTYKPGSGLFSGGGVLALDGVPPAPRADGVSPLAGMSGAAVFVRGVLLGVVSGDPVGWQHGRVTVTPVDRLFDDPDFVAVRNAHGLRVLRRIAPPGQSRDESAEFEHDYAAYVAKRHDTLRIFGIDLRARGRATWPLDAAYYSLEAAPGVHRAAGDWAVPGGQAPAGPGGALPAEQALAGHDRVLLRGVAGSGKSTLVQWLAVSTARQDLGEELAHLRDLVPFVLPLRSVVRRVGLPRPEDFVAAGDAPMTPPPRWAEHVLKDRRALVLVDGLDEIDERARERVAHWLRGLLAAYPGNRWLVTSRPSAVEDAWLAGEGFTELTLSPMSRADVRAFTERWHRAARDTAGGDPAERASIDSYERSLLAALRSKQDLARLATNPLMCGLICALHRDRGGYLPTGRKELYDAALSMLLVRRDQERDLAPALTEAPQVQLLQKLAYWLVKNGQAEMDRADAVALIGAALPAMPAVAELGDATAVYRYLLDRSGLLREPATDSVDFVHRTFQDYLAARAAVEDRDFELMARNAHHDQWSDVIRMAVAHGRPDERARLLRKLVARGDRIAKHRTRLHLLALACLEHATELDPAVRALVEERGAALIPPRSDAEAEELAAVGPLVLELLPGPEGLDDDEALAVVRTAFKVGGDAAVAVLTRFTGHPSRSVRWQLAVRPPGTDLELHAAEVLDLLPRDTTDYWVRSVEEVRTLSRIGGVRGIRCMPPVSFPEFADGFGSLAALKVIDVGSTVSNDDLTVLCALPGLRELTFRDASELTDLSPLIALTSLTSFGLYRAAPDLALEELALLPELDTVALDHRDGEGPAIAALPAGLPIRTLYSPYAGHGLDGIERIPHLEDIGYGLARQPFTRRDWDRLAAMPRLTAMTGSSVLPLFDPGFPPLPGIRRLGMSAFDDPGLLLPVPVLFPGLRVLTLYPVSSGPGRPARVIDLAPLAALPELSMVILADLSPSPTLLNLDALPDHVTIRPRPRT